MSFSEHEAGPNYSSLEPEFRLRINTLAQINEYSAKINILITMEEALEKCKTAPDPNQVLSDAIDAIFEAKDPFVAKIMDNSTSSILDEIEKLIY